MKVKTKEPKTEVAVVPQAKSLPALPPEWQTELATAAKDASSVEQTQAQSFSLRAGVLSYNEQPMPDNKVKVIVLASAFENAMFINKFDPNNIVPPLCFALSDTGEDMEAHDNSFKKQGTNNDGVCLGCPQSEWGSDENSPSGRGKKCKETRRLALIPVDALEAGIDKAQVALLRVPVTSVANWAAYVHMLTATAKRPPWSVITEISVKPDPKKQFTVNFEPVDAINDPALLTTLKDNIGRARAACSVPYAMMTAEQFKEITEEKEQPKKKAKY